MKVDEHPAVAVGAVRTPAVEPPKARPVLWWAAAGAASVAMMVIMFSLWMTSGNVKPTPSGPTPIGSLMMAALVFWQAFSVVGMLVCVYIWVVRPVRREGRISFDGLLLLSLFTLYWLDPIGNIFGITYTYNTHLIQFGSWANYLPGWVVPRGQYFPEPALFEWSTYIYAIMPPIVLGNYLMRRAKDRWPHLSTVRLLSLTFGFFVVLDVAIEVPWLLSGVYVYTSGIKGLTLFGGHYYQFPLYEAILWPAIWTVIAALRFYRNDKGLSFAERGIERVHVSEKQKAVLRFLALSGFLNLAILVVYMGPWLMIHQASNNWPKDIADRSYLTDYMCGPGTGYACPSSDVPRPHRNSAHVNENGELVPAGE